MKTLAIKLTRIGNSRGIRLPSKLIQRYGLAGGMAMEARNDGLFLKALQPGKLSWEEAAEAMAGSTENWDEWDAVAEDGLPEVPWHASSGGGKPARRATGAKKPPRQPAK